LIDPKIASFAVHTSGGWRVLSRPQRAERAIQLGEDILLQTRDRLDDERSLMQFGIGSTAAFDFPGKP
jgi:hypothetical protein